MVLRFCRSSALPRRQPEGLEFERIEPRVLLAGDVSVFVDSGRLIVTGDGLANEILIVGQPNGSASVRGLGGTTINGGTAAFSAGSSLLTVAVQLNDGDDNARLLGLVLQSDLVVHGGAGNDVLEIRHSRVSDFFADTGAGDDVLKLDNLYALQSSMSLTGAGHDVISVIAHASGGNIAFATGSGDDTLAVNNMGMFGALQIDTGEGDDQVLFAGLTFIGRDSRIGLGTGDDFLGILPGLNERQSRVQKFSSIDGGGGNDGVALDGGVRLADRTSVGGNAGIDSFQRGGAVFGKTEVHGFENAGFAGLPAALDSLFGRLESVLVDPSIFGGPELQRILSVATSAGTTTFVEDQGPVTVDSGLVVDGPDGSQIVSATVAILGFAGGQDSLEFDATTAIGGTFNAQTGVLSLTGTGSLAEWQSVLRSVRFVNSSQAPSNANRTIRFTINSADETATATRTLAVVSRPDAPVLEVTSEPRVFDIDDPEGTRPLPVDPDLILTDVDTSGFSLVNVTVSIAAGMKEGDVLSFAPQAGVSGSFSPDTGVLTFTGTLSAQNLQTLLRSVTFDSSEERPLTGTRAITFLVSDGDLVASQTVDIDVIASASIAIELADSIVNFTETDEPVAVDPLLTVTPGANAPDDLVDSATVRFVSGFVAGQDELSFTAVDGITGAFNAATGVLEFTGTASASVYQTLLRSVVYANDATGDDLTTGDRSIEFRIVSHGNETADSRTLRVSPAGEQQLIENWLEENGLTPEVTASGLHFIIEQEGNGEHPTLNDSVTVNYTGFFLDGTVFDSGQGVTFALLGVIKGWQEGVPLFSVGGSGQLIIPSDLAYGETGSPPTIPPNTILRFEIELLAIS